MGDRIRKKRWMDWIMIFAGTCLVSLGIKCIYDPISLITGGFTGIAIIVKEITGDTVNGGIPLWLTNLILNVPVFLIALKVKGKRFIGRSRGDIFAVSLAVCAAGN